MRELPLQRSAVAVARARPCEWTGALRAVRLLRAVDTSDQLGLAKHGGEANAAALADEARDYLALLFGGFMAGVGGSCLVLTSAGMFLDGIASGRGWVAIAIVIFGAWRPWNILAASLFFAFLDSLQNQLQSVGFTLIPYQFVSMLPYVVTILVLLISRKRSGAPMSLGVPYLRE